MLPVHNFTGLVLRTLDDEDEIDQCSPAPSTAKGTSTLKHFAPISNPSNTETVVPPRLHSIYGTCSCTHNTLKLKGR